MKKLFLFGLLFGAFWLITGCRGEIPTGMDAPTNTATLMVDSSRALSPTISPSLTPTPNPTATPTSTPSSTPFEVLPLMTSHEAWPEVTPIATPILGMESYRLKTWTEADALELIHTMEVYAHDNDVPAPAHGRFEFPEAYVLVELAVREMQYRFPNSAYQEKVDWRLAMANVIQGKSDSDEWILETITTFLSQHPLTELDEYLLEQGFLIDEQVVVPNLMGDNRPAIVLRVQAQDNFGDQGLVFALQLDEQGTYQLFPIHSFWTIIASGERIVDTLDHNKNGIPEVVLETSASSGSFCFSDIYVFEWREREFVDLTQGEIGSDDCMVWKFSEPDSEGLDTISVPNVRTPSENIYTWNDTFYELSERRFNRGARYCFDYETLLSSWPDYTRGIAALETVLTNWSDENAGDVGPVCQDYLRFQIGMAYAINAQSSKALAAFQNLAQSPANPEATYISSAANTFLQHFKSQNDLAASCVAAQTTLDELSPSSQDWQFGPLCDWDSVIPLFIATLNPTQIPDPIPLFEQIEVEILASFSLDVDNDGDLDWFIAASPISTRDSIWVLLNVGESFQAIYLNDVYDDEDITIENTFRGESFILPETGEMLTVLWAGRRFNIYQIGKPPEIAQNLLHEIDVQQYKFDQITQNTELSVFFKDYSYGVGTLGFYRWNPIERVFQNLPLYDNDLFSTDGPAKALPYLEQIVSNIETHLPKERWDRPRILYLLGLAYELTGDTQHALETYWTIWHDHPDTGYARMACSKIENCVP